MLLRCLADTHTLTHTNRMQGSCHSGLTRYGYLNLQALDINQDLFSSDIVLLMAQDLCHTVSQDEVKEGRKQKAKHIEYIKS